MKKSVLVFILFLVFGVVLVKQHQASSKLISYTSPETTSVLAREVVVLLLTNSSLNQTLEDLRSQQKIFSEDVIENKQAIDQITQAISQLKILNGEAKISGPGIEIFIEGELNTANVVDLINALRNIGVEAIAINNKRVILRDGFKVFERKLKFGQNEVELPLTILAIGNPEILYQGITRRGGILDQLNKAANIKAVAKKAELITLPSR